MMLGWMIAALLAAQGPPERLGWMVGDWSCRRAEVPVRYDEYWIADRRGGLVGIGRVSGDRTRALEHMRIAVGADGRISFFGSPNGAAPVAFPLVRATDSEAVFENPGHDYPQRVAYRRDGERLVATVSLIDGSQAESWAYAPAGESAPPACSLAD